MRPEEDGVPLDFASHVVADGEGAHLLHLMVDGLQCAACVWLIESVLAHQPGVESARVNMTTRRLTLKWRGTASDADELVGAVGALGYRLVPYDPVLLDRARTRHEKELLRAMAVAGFAAGNVMLLSVSVWAGHWQGMGPATRDLFHWLSALIALPAIAYAGLPFFRSALTALRARHVNMDVPISLAIILAAGMSLADTIEGRQHAYFDSAVMLLFFLLIGRYLDHRARGKARNAAEHLLTLGAVAVTVVDQKGRKHLLPPSRVERGMTVFVAAGERISVDGKVASGMSDLDVSLITGETVPTAAVEGTKVFAGTLNLSGPLRITVDAVGDRTLLAEIARLVEAAEQGRADYVALADRIARRYSPVVHTLALATFLGWLVLGDVGWRDALLYAVAVLIITCPCALALAVPVVQVVATGRLLRQGILVKTATALERLAGVDTIVFDKTGTLTTGHLDLQNLGEVDVESLRLASSLAAASTHPLARALARAHPDSVPSEGVREVPGEGMALETTEGEIRLGRRRWCGVRETDGGVLPEMWLARPGVDPVRFVFGDRVREDATAVVATLGDAGFDVRLLSGDRGASVSAVAAELGIEAWQAGVSPQGKSDELRSLAADGKQVLMVGDGLNDAAALAAARASMSPSTAADISQTAADIVFQGVRLHPVLETLSVARQARTRVRQNFALTFLYNAIAVPFAVAGYVTPLIAALAMSASSIAVIVNGLRLNWGRSRWIRS